MAVLSDKTIKEMIKDNKLVPNGNIDNATHCCYEFTAALMLRGGSNQTERIVEPEVIEPAQLVWIKAREEISMPADMVGVWIQTQTLARQGLLLLNITLIEPGYEGPLSAVLVNFGKKDVVIGPETNIAKVIFLPLDSEADKLVDNKKYEKYNTALMDVAVNAPKTFLQLQSFEKKADDILGTMKKQMKQEVSKLSEQVKGQLKNDLQGELKWTLFKWGGSTLSGLALGCLIVWLMINSYLPRLSEYSKFDELARRAAMTQQAEIITDLNTQINTLATEIEFLKKQMQGEATTTTPSPDANNTVQNQ